MGSPALVKASHRASESQPCIFVAIVLDVLVRVRAKSEHHIFQFAHGNGMRKCIDDGIARDGHKLSLFRLDFLSRRRVLEMLWCNRGPLCTQVCLLENIHALGIELSNKLFELCCESFVLRPTFFVSLRQQDLIITPDQHREQASPAQRGDG